MTSVGTLILNTKKMKKLSTLDGFINEDLTVGNTNVGRMGQLRVVKTEDKMGYYVDFVISGSVRTGDLPAAAMQHLEGIIEKMEILLNEELPEMQ